MSSVAHWVSAACCIALACDGASEPTPAPLSESAGSAGAVSASEDAAGAGGTSSAGVSGGADLGRPPDAGPPPGCPGPRVSIGGGEPVWARDPETGACCEYADLLAVPQSWPAFPTSDACENDCRCSRLEGFIEDVGDFSTERTSLDCRCATGECPSTFAEAQAALCSGERPVSRAAGCGLLLLADANGLFGQGWVFDAERDALVGAYSFSDTNMLPCQTYTWIAGRQFECDEAERCMLCGEPTATLPSCE